MVGEAAEPAEAEDEQARFRLFDAITTFLTTASGSRPLVIVLDDLHWADEPSLRLLEFLVRNIADASLLVIGTYRDVELGRHHPLSRVLGDLARTERASRIVLRGLDAEDIDRFVEMTAGSRADPRLVSAVHEQTEGNPFFVAEVVRPAGQRAPAGRRLGRLAIPQGVREVVGRRLDQLSGGERGAQGRRGDRPRLRHRGAGAGLRRRPRRGSTPRWARPSPRSSCSSAPARGATASRTRSCGRPSTRS